MTASSPRSDIAAQAERLVGVRPWLERGRRAWIPLGPGDRPAVEDGETVSPITLIAERLRDARLVSFPSRGLDPERLAPSAHIGPELPLSWRRTARLGGEGAVLYRAPGGRVVAVVGRLREPLLAHADGKVLAVTPGGIALGLVGHALPGVVAAGQPVHGQLRLAVPDPADELRPRGLDVADAGSIVVAGARVDVETLTRARALGIRGVITGGIAGHDLRAFARSELRQRATLHPLPAFAVLVVEGFGRRSLAGPPFELLLAAAGSSVAIFTDPPLLVFDPAMDPPPVPGGTVRIAAGPGGGTAGRIDGALAIHRFDEGVHLLAVPFVGGGRRFMVPLADLERFQ